MTEEKDDLPLADLDRFCGTEQYHAGFLGINLTDGVAYIVKNGYSWFVSDFSAVAKTKLKNEEFLSVDLKLGTNNTADMVVTDGNGNELYKQHYGFTDAKREFRLFFVDNVLMLAGEY